MPETTDHTTAPPSTEKQWLANPDFLRLFLRMFIRADEIGGIPETVKLIKSLVKASGVSPQAVIATIQTYLLTCDHDNPVLH